MNEAQYNERVAQAFQAIVRAFDHVDVDDADLDSAGDVLTITYRDGVRAVVNTQRPTHQIWFAGAGRAWHFSFVDARDAWLDDKRFEEELFATLVRVTREHAGIELPLGAP